VEDRVGAVAHGGLTHRFRVRRVDQLEGPRVDHLGLGVAQVGREHLGGPVDIPKPGDQPGADLAACAGDEDALQGWLRVKDGAM
jgi:hypothetical protein